MRLCGGMPSLPGNRSIVSYEIATVHPLRLPLRAATSPYTGEATPRRFLRMEFGASGRAAAITGPIAGLS